MSFNIAWDALVKSVYHSSANSTKYTTVYCYTSTTISHRSKEQLLTDTVLHTPPYWSITSPQACYKMELQLLLYNCCHLLLAFHTVVPVVRFCLLILPNISLPFLFPISFSSCHSQPLLKLCLVQDSLSLSWFNNGDKQRFIQHDEGYGNVRFWSDGHRLLLQGGPQQLGRPSMKWAPLDNFKLGRHSQK